MGTNDFYNILLHFLQLFLFFFNYAENGFYISLIFASPIN